jgi:hypothetical protein
MDNGQNGHGHGGQLLRYIYSIPYTYSMGGDEFKSGKDLHFAIYKYEYDTKSMRQRQGWFRFPIFIIYFVPRY